MTTTRPHSPPSPARRTLRFGHIDEIADDVRRIAGSNRTLRRWTFGQICAHLAASFHGSIDGFDYSNHRIKRALFRLPMLIYTYRFGIPEQYRVDANIEPVAPVSDHDGANRLYEAIDRYAGHAGPLRPHPLFGRLTRRQWDRIHCIHGAHHLSFVIPAAPRWDAE